MDNHIGRDELILEVPDSHRPERAYCISLLFDVWFKCCYTIKWVANKTESRLIYGGKSIVVPDHFFSEQSEPITWSSGQLPTRFAWSECEVDDQPIRFPLFFGLEWILSRDSDSLVLGTDVFAHIFFYVSRWEEMVISEKDEHGRVKESELFAVKNGFHKQASLDALLASFEALLKDHLENSTIRKSTYQVKITHDVDHLRRYDTVKKWISAVGGDIILRRRPLLALDSTYDFLRVKLGLKRDNYDNYDWLMSLSEQYGLKSHFYFMPTYLGEEDARYDIREVIARQTIEEIERRGHVVGLHGSYAASYDPSLFQRELLRLRDVSHNISEGRQHFLKFRNPLTWRMWNEAGMERDSTLGLSRDVGFRCGTSKSYPVFDLIERVQLSLIEEPLVLMEVPLVREYKSVDRCLSEAMALVDECRKYDGQFVFLWHPENFNHPYWKQFSSLYELILDYANQGLD